MNRLPDYGCDLTALGASAPNALHSIATECSRQFMAHIDGRLREILSARGWTVKQAREAGVRLVTVEGMGGMNQRIMLGDESLSGLFVASFEYPEDGPGTSVLFTIRETFE